MNNGNIQEEEEFIEDSKIDINKLKRTDLPFNQFVSMPGGVSEEEEIRLHKFKNEVKSIAESLKTESKGWSNLSEGELKGLERLKERIGEREIVCYKTDKSGRWAVDTIQNYRECAMELVSDENKIPSITMKTHDVGEREMNCHALALVRMMGARNDKTGDRIRWTITADGTKVAPLYGLRKDHKEVMEGQEAKGPKMRPVSGSEDCSTKRVGYILSKILTEIIPRNTTQCESTDELLREFEVVNRGDVDEGVAVGSLDVESLYPSLDISKCARIVGMKLLNSELEFENLNWKEIALYIRYQYDDEELKKRGIIKFCPLRKHGGRPPMFEGSGSEKCVKKRLAPWRFVNKPPGEKIVRIMFCLGIEAMNKRTMSLHDFKFDGKVYRQTKGGAIGLDLTGVIADIYMCYWDGKLIDLINDRKWKLIVYKRYKDDINFIVSRGAESDQEKSVYENEGETVGEIKKMAESIDPAIRVTTDARCEHEDKKLPLLDIKVWIGKNAEGKTKILHEHYMKDVASRSVIWERSAHSEKTKFNVMVNEVMRIMKNCSVDLDWQVIAEHVTHLMRRMQFSGYDHKFRYRVVTRALQKYDIRKRRYDEIGTMFYPPKPKKNTKERQEWYKGGGRFETVMFVSTTPGAILKKKIEKVARSNQVKVKVVEKASLTMKGALQRSYPFPVEKCERPDCVICRIGMNVDCRTRGCVYKIECNECNRKYGGQTGRSIYERIKEHENDNGKRMEKCPLWKHSLEYHEGRAFEYGVNILSECFGKPSRRLITEALEIDRMGPDETMNSKREWSYVKLSKVRLI